MPGSNPAIGGGGFHHIAMRVPDFDSAVKFYTEGLGFTEKLAWGQGEQRAVMLDTGDGSYLEIFAGGTDEPGVEGSLLHFALRTSNCDAALARARVSGAEVTMEPKDVDIPSTPHPTPVRIAFCQGPAGEIIEFFQSDQL